MKFYASLLESILLYEYMKKESIIFSLIRSFPKILTSLIIYENLLFVAKFGTDFSKTHAESEISYKNNNKNFLM